MFKRLTALIWKEFLAVIKDPKIRMAILAPPILQLLIFTRAATLDVTNIPMGILNRDSGKEAYELVQRFEGSPLFNRIYYLKSMEEVAPFIENQQGVMVLSIDAAFSRKLRENGHAEIQCLLDGRKSNTAQIVLKYATAIIQTYKDDFVAEHKIPQPNAQLISRYWYNPNLNYDWYNISSLVCILTMSSCLAVTTQSIARERELGTFDQLLVSPLSTWEILVGKTIPGIVIGMLGGVLLLVVEALVFRVPFVGSLPLFFLSQFVFVCAMSGFGLFISSLCTTQQQAMLGSFVLIIPCVLLSGFATPIENMPVWLQYVTYLIPLRYMLINTKGIMLKDIPAEMVLSNIEPMLLIAAVTLSVAAFFFHRRLE